MWTGVYNNRIIIAYCKRKVIFLQYAYGGLWENDWRR